MDEIPRTCIASTSLKLSQFNTAQWTNNIVIVSGTLKRICLKNI
jgi:hypothetical protein